MAKKKKKKLRVAFRKNRTKRARHNIHTEELLAKGLDEADLVSTERISGKGDLSRQRTVIANVQQGDDGESLQIDVDEDACLAGRVLRSVGLATLVETNEGRTYECSIRQVVRDMATEARNAVVAGDRVLFLPSDDKHGVIERVEPRKGTLSRTSQYKKHTIVANIDQVVIVVSADDPPLKPNLIDRFLISTEKGEARPVVCINKVDLVDVAKLQPIAGMYAQLGYAVVLVSALEGRGVARLRELLRNVETVFTGQSGVGKSSLLNAIQPGLGLATKEVSDWTSKGRHTTRRAELLKLEMGGWVVDTPGIRQLELWDVIPEEIEGYFVEFRPFVTHCKYPDCTHTHEDNCGIKKAVAHQLVTQRRYESYLKLLDGNKPRKNYRSSNLDSLTDDD